MLPRFKSCQASDTGQFSVFSTLWHFTLALINPKGKPQRTFGNRKFEAMFHQLQAVIQLCVAAVHITVNKKPSTLKLFFSFFCFLKYSPHIRFRRNATSMHYWIMWLAFYQLLTFTAKWDRTRCTLVLYTSASDYSSCPLYLLPATISPT